MPDTALPPLPGPGPAPDPADGPGSAPADLHWQPLPAQARLLFVLGLVPLLPAAAGIGAALGVLAGHAPAGALVALALGLAHSLWLGPRQYRATRWRLEPQGLAVRRGRLWQSETRVPASRVQHLDVRQGPLQRRLGLATLVVHTAGTRNNSVAVPHLDAAVAERLRERLSRQVEAGDDD